VCQIRHVLKPVPVGSEQPVADVERRRRAVVETERVDADRGDRTTFEQPVDRVDVKAREVVDPGVVLPPVGPLPQRQAALPPGVREDDCGADPLAP